MRIHFNSFPVSNSIEHRDGVSWCDSPLPRRWHKCKTQTTGWIGFARVLRCACGAISDNQIGSPIWDERNSRRADRRAKRREGR